MTTKPPPVSSFKFPVSLAWRLRATFAGKLPPRTYTTPDIRHTNPGWDSEVFNRRIESLELFLPTGHKILLSGMEAYNFFIEATQAFSRNSGARIEAFWLCGKLPGTVTPPPPSFQFPVSSIIDMWRIGQGKVIRQRQPWGREWGGTPTRGWKEGLVGSAPISEILVPGPCYPPLTLGARSIPPFDKGGQGGGS